MLVAEAAGGLDSLAHAARAVRRGTPVVIAGATECPLSPYALACQLRSGLLSDVADPERAYRPFDATASGYLPAEGERCSWWRSWGTRWPGEPGSTAR